MHQSTTPSLSQTIWARWASRQFLSLPIVQTLLRVTFGYSQSSEAVVMRQLRRWNRLWRRSLTYSHKRSSMGLSEVVETLQVHFSRRRLLGRGLEFQVSTVNKSAHTKKSGNLSYAPRNLENKVMAKIKRFDKYCLLLQWHQILNKFYVDLFYLCSKPEISFCHTMNFWMKYSKIYTWFVWVLFFFFRVLIYCAVVCENMRSLLNSRTRAYTLRNTRVSKMFCNIFCNVWDTPVIPDAFVIDIIKHNRKIPLTCHLSCVSGLTGFAPVS